MVLTLHPGTSAGTLQYGAPSTSPGDWVPAAGPEEAGAGAGEGEAAEGSWLPQAVRVGSASARLRPAARASPRAGRDGRGPGDGRGVGDARQGRSRRGSGRDLDHGQAYGRPW